MGNGGETKGEGKQTTGRFRASIRLSDSLLVRHSPYKGWGGVGGGGGGRSMGTDMVQW